MLPQPIKIILWLFGKQVPCKALTLRKRSVICSTELQQNLCMWPMGQTKHTTFVLDYGNRFYDGINPILLVKELWEYYSGIRGLPTYFRFPIHPATNPGLPGLTIIFNPSGSNPPKLALMWIKGTLRYPAARCGQVHSLSPRSSAG